MLPLALTVTEGATIVLSLANVSVLAAISVVWFRIYRVHGGPSKSMFFAFAAMFAAISFLAMEEFVQWKLWFEAMEMVSFTASGAFLLDASFDVAAGKL
ncbi:MAG: hypothetical protein MAG715_01356 [Methanonatronarchaeales archaeon]|nr:hypothetical protein [Methanonatronarchaeales archaeon]